MFVQSLHVFTTTQQGLLGILQELRNTTAENMERRSGNVTSAQRSMLFSQIGKLTLKPVVLESIDVIVEPFFPGKFFTYSYNIYIVFLQFENVS